ncbi:MAG: TonB-dependent receptor [Prolixibacteraceae bacterium]|nr:TonB-dependent receptor [Prolixibacteraceae bacterium]
MKHLFLLAFCIILTHAAKSQLTQSVRGTVVDKVTQNSLPGAAVVIRYNNQTQGTISAENGTYLFTGIPVGKHHLEVSFMGYEPVSLRNIEVRSGKECILHVELLEKVVKMDEIVVSAFKNGETRNKMAVLSARRFSVRETEKYAGSWGDPSRMAANYAGVITANDSRNDIIIRGNSPQGLLWRLEGVNIPNPNHFAALGSTGGPVSMLNNNLLANSDFFTGAFPAEYGNALSGVFDLKLRNGNNAQHEFTGQMGFGGIELGAEGPLSKKTGSSYMINYRYSIPGLMDVLGFSPTGSAVPNYQDLSFKINLPAKNLGNFALFGLGGISAIEFINEGDTNGSTYDISANARTRNGSNTGILALTHRLPVGENAMLFSTLSATRAYGSTQIDSLSDDRVDKRFYAEGNLENKLGFSSRYTQKVNARNTLNAGIHFDAWSVHFTDSITGEVYDPPMPERYIYQINTEEKGINLLQAHAEWQHRLNQQLTFYAGLHFQDFLYNQSLAFDPRFSLSYQLANRGKISLAYGKHSQIQPLYIYFAETYLQENDEYKQTNKELDLTRAHHLIAGYDQLLGQNLKLKVETYYQALYDVPVHSEAGWFSMVNAGNSFHQERVGNLINDGTGRNLGIELTLEKYLDDHYYFLITTSLFDSKYRGSDAIWRNTEFNTNYVVNALGGYEIIINENMSVDLNLRTVWSGGKRNPFIDLEQSKAAGYTVYDHEKDYSFREKDYFKLDFRVSLMVNGKKTTQEWALDLTNVSNHQNVYSRSYNAEQQTIMYVYQQGFYPMFLYRINF